MHKLTHSRSWPLQIYLLFVAISSTCFTSHLLAQQLVDHLPTSHKTTNNYKQYYNLSSTSSVSSAGNSESFVATTSIEINAVPTKDQPLIVTDSYSSRSGSAISSIEINHFFPADKSSITAIDDPNLNEKFKNLSEVVLSLDVKPKELTQAEKELIVLNAEFNALSSTTLNIYVESSSPTFVSSFQNVLFDKKMITR